MVFVSVGIKFFSLKWKFCLGKLRLKWCGFMICSLWFRYFEWVVNLDVGWWSFW